MTPRAGRTAVQNLVTIRQAPRAPQTLGIPALAPVGLGLSQNQWVLLKADVTRLIDASRSFSRNGVTRLPSLVTNGGLTL